MEASLNAQDVLIELVETEKTLDIFLQDNGAFINQLMELAIDPSNSHNQPYLLKVLLKLAQSLKPNDNKNVFKDLDENVTDNKNEENPKLATFMGLIKENEFFYNLTILINSKGLKGTDSFSQNEYTNQNGKLVRKIGLTRLRSLELLEVLLSLLNPTLGPLAKLSEVGEGDKTENTTNELDMDKFISK